jgi:hypothetical protein
MDGKKLKKVIISSWLPILLVAVFFLRLPSLFEPHSYGDEGVYLTVGLALRKGLLLYRDIFDNKPPLLYLLAALSGGMIFWFRFLLLASVLTSIYFFQKLADKIFSSSAAVKAATLIFALLTTIRLIEGNIANAEIFILLPVISGFYFIFWLLEQKTKNYWHFLAAGLILSFSFLLKVPAVFDFAVIFAFLVFFREKKKIFHFGRKEVFLLGGYLLPILLTALFFLIRGAFGLFLDACFKQTLGYLFSWKTGSHIFSFSSLVKSDLLARSIILLAGLGVLFSFRKKLNFPLLFISLWFIFALFGATLSGRPYPHYLLQVLPPFSLMMALPFAVKAKSKWIVVGSLAVLLSMSIIRYRFWFYPTLSYYQNFCQFILGQKNKIDYLAFFGSETPQIYELAQFVNENTAPEERIFVWGNNPHLYALSRRLPAGPYTVAYHIQDFHQEKLVTSLIGQKLPSLIIVSAEPPLPSALRTSLEEKYRLIKRTLSFTVWQRRTQP